MQKSYLSAAAVLVLAALSVAAAGRGEAPLIDAVKQGDTKAVRELMQRRVDVNATEVDGTTALHWAVYRNDLAMVDQLIRAGANVPAWG
jgi:ankyrin repeat protein